MRLKRLTLHGYKTFASKTVFDFEGRITAVIGPNGSGKSNIADAIRWVLGEQSYSTLRGKKTTDMIFTGSQQRPRAGMAQAILTLDNSEGWLPIDYSEIEISRRAYRSGENEYLLNGQKVRLRDVFELLANSGLAQRTYTIIGQGLIDRALSLRADERRSLFEEAAGVSHYKVKRADAIRKLQETNHNLERLQDILAEIRPRLNSLRQKASRAQNYSQVAADLHHHLRILYGYQWQHTRRELRRSRDNSEDARQKWETGRQAQQTAQAEVDAIRVATTQIEEEVEEAERQKELRRDDFERARREVAILQERLALWNDQLEVNMAELPEHEVLQLEAREALKEALEDLSSAQQELDQHQAIVEKLEFTFQSQQKEILQDQQTIESIEQTYDKCQENLALAKGRLDQLARQKSERLQALEEITNLLDLKNEVIRLKEEGELAESFLLETQTQIVDERRKREEINLNLNMAVRKLEQLTAEKSDEREKLAEAEARQDLLSQILDGDEILHTDVDVLGRFFEFVSVPEDYRIAVEACLGRRAATWLLSENEALWKLIEDFRGQRIFAAALNDIKVIASLKLPKDQEVIGWLSDLIKAEAEVQTIVKLLLGRALLVKNRSAAYRLASKLPLGSMTVTLNGIVVHAGGLIERKRDDSDTGILSRQDAWRRSAEKVAKLKNSMADIMESQQRQQALIEAEKARLARIDSVVDELTYQEKQQNQKLAHVDSDLELAKHKLSTSESNRTSIQRELAKLESSITELGEYIGGLLNDRVEIEEELKKAKERLSDRPITENQAKRTQYLERYDSIRMIVAGRKAVVDSRRATLNQIDGQIHRRKERIKEINHHIQSLDLDAHQMRLNDLQAQMEAVNIKIAPLRQKLFRNRRALNRQEAALSNAHKSSHELESHYTQARIELGQRQNKLDNLKERIQSDLGIVALEYDREETTQSPLPLAEIVEKLPEVRELPDDIHETIQRYRGQLNRMGAIDPEAPVEYEETTSRYDFLSQQVVDLSRTQGQLQEVISDLDDMTSRAFAATVTKTDAVFREIFKRLFGGGAAQLVLTEPDDLTLSGVDIVARLPRRREQGLALLSGGERSLTAAALIFALLRVSPTPFCVLDEVDAMLDDANVTRFRDQLRELSEQTQFIIITHNRGTVQVAESVYGISMGRDSASQVVSIRPEDFVNERSRG